MSDFFVVGESLVDIFEGRDGRRTEVPGGSPANVALGLARLGMSGICSPGSRLTFVGATSPTISPDQG